MSEHGLNKDSATLSPRVAIVGATGAVGGELIRCLEARNFPLRELKLLASPRSAGKRLQFRGEMLPVHELTSTSLLACDYPLLSRILVTWLASR
ncbi:MULTISPECIES: hypothetical protein [Paraburkholderia]|uniref:Semialdehyde dehydrogenase NAD-binding domain-containing protein n=1 Tax=Paraburkholderia podalyriae TaxID=1938811 RepID=A0ABR7PU17_9BURK|nr:hypothetical protein [Paraburkholderia podalyriae]MBC8749772.1 hypothetical protein [Paraburkholderia podalyriae]